MVLDEILDLFEHPRWMMLDGKKKLDDVLASVGFVCTGNPTYWTHIFPETTI